MIDRGNEFSAGDRSDRAFVPNAERPLCGCGIARNPSARNLVYRAGGSIVNPERLCRTGGIIYVRVQRAAGNQLDSAAFVAVAVAQLTLFSLLPLPPFSPVSVPPEIFLMTPPLLFRIAEAYPVPSVSAYNSPPEIFSMVPVLLMASVLLPEPVFVI